MGYTLDLDFSPGAAFAEKVYDCYGSMIQPSDESGHLTMVVSFNRHSFRLNEDSVAATWKQLLVVMRLIYWSHALRTWSSHSMFRASRLVLSFLIFGLTLARNSNVFFHLWGQGGPNWVHEFAIWKKECDVEWIIISPSKLSFAQFEGYTACKGYCFRVVQAKIDGCLMAGYDLRPQERLPVPP